MPLIGYVMSVVIGCSFVLYFMMIPFVGMVSGKYFDKQFILRRKPLPFVFAGFATRRTMRGVAYLGFMIMNQNRFLNCRFWSKGSNKAKFAREWMPFNYREVARAKDWVIGILFFSGMILLFGSLIVAGILGKIFHY